MHRMTHVRKHLLKPRVPLHDRAHVLDLLKVTSVHHGLLVPLRAGNHHLHLPRVHPVTKKPLHHKPCVRAEHNHDPSSSHGIKMRQLCSSKALDHPNLGSIVQFLSTYLPHPCRRAIPKNHFSFQLLPWSAKCIHHTNSLFVDIQRMLAPKQAAQTLVNLELMLLVLPIPVLCDDFFDHIWPRLNVHFGHHTHSPHQPLCHTHDLLLVDMLRSTGLRLHHPLLAVAQNVLDSPVFLQGWHL
mmetsp:Transcript_16428/g.32441  ORF Transcript_16428/g.32441 Transcript_16428/m.32441 type:complete len:241 (-) Transcript_16428:391-1113(-)